VRASLTLLLIPALGCGSALDLESARAIFRRPEPPAVPLLAEEPVPLAAPAGLQSFSGRLRAIALSWDPVLAGEVAGYVIERSLDAEGPFEPIAHVSGRFQTTFVDRGSDLAVKRGSDQALTGLGDGEEYTYRVRSFRSDGRRGAQTSPLASSFTAAVPESPEGLRAYSHLPRRVALSWRPVDDPTVAGYVVYRSPSASGEFRQIARIDDAYETSFVDRNLGALRVFYYRVATRNAAGGEGPAAEAVRAVTKPEPLPPVGLAVAKRSLGATRLRWRPNVERDLTGYRLLRTRENADEAEVVTEVDAERTEAEDREVGAAEALQYRLVAIDEDGLESAPSEPIRVEAAGYGLQARAERDAVRLSWDPSVHAELAELRVMRAGRLRAREVARATGAEYIDQDVRPGSRYRYVLIGVRSDGSEAPPSRAVEVELPEDGAAPAE
jgi:fibronectin type 3 domain-containing protein